MNRIVVVAVAIAFLVSGSAGAAEQKKAKTVKPGATITMEKGGEITIELFPGDAPKTVGNFVKLARRGSTTASSSTGSSRASWSRGAIPRGTARAGPGT